MERPQSYAIGHQVYVLLISLSVIALYVVVLCLYIFIVILCVLTSRSLDAVSYMCSTLDKNVLFLHNLNE